ncbi:hypothetical protein BDV10DRAFT_121972 [Aspergillus recurvatus]
MLSTYKKKRTGVTVSQSNPKRKDQKWCINRRERRHSILLSLQNHMRNSCSLLVSSFERGRRQVSSRSKRPHYLITPNATE